MIHRENTDGLADAAFQLAAIVESSEDAIIGKTVEGIIQSWNGAAERIYGYTAEEMIGRPMTVLIPEDRPDEEPEILRRIQRGERVQHFRTVRIRKGGKPINVSITVSAIKNDRGEVVGASHIARDMSAATEYAERIGELAAIVESSDDAIIGKTLDGVVKSWNAGAERIYGYAAEEMIGRSMVLLLPPGRENEESEVLASIRRGERLHHFETTRQRKDGQLVNVSLTISPVKDGTGQIIGASHIAKEIGEKVRLETATAQLAAIVESSDDAIISKNLDGIILTWNKGAERIYGYEAEEIIWRPMTLLLPPDRADEEAGILDRMRRSERVEHFETERIRKDGKKISVSLTISPIRDTYGRIRGASHVARDITARKQFEQQMLQAQKLETLGVLAGGVAHDFNNLLTGILGNSSLALEGLPPSNPNRALLRDVVAASERAANLTKQLLAYAGKGRFITETVDVSELTREITGLVESTIPKNVQLRLDLKSKLPMVEADPGQLQQVIMNLVINGAEAIGKEAGTVLVTTNLQDVDAAYCATVLGGLDLVEGQYVTLEVHDTGCGMDADTLQRIFDPFFTTKFTGRGLGLAAVLGIVQGHKGALKVYSTPGRGSTFKLLLPIANRERPLRPSPAVANLRGTGTVLIVDDEKLVRDTAGNTLSHFGYAVLKAADGLEAIEVFRKNMESINLILLDLTMPVMGGEEALRHLRTAKPDVQVLLSSGFNEVEAIRRFTGKGLAGFIQKPYTAVQLAHKVRAILTGSGAI